MNLKNNISRDDIAEKIYKDFGFSRKDCLDIVNNIIDLIIEGLEANGFVKIHNFGTFKLKRKKSRIGRNPKTLEKKIINERNVILFRASKELKDFINKKDD